MPFLAIFSLVATLILAVSYWCYRKCFYAPPNRRSTPYDPMVGPQYEAVADTIYRIVGIMERYSYEDVSITAQDGIALRGRYYHFTDGAPLLILCHGYRSAALRDCCGGHALARKMGFNALVIHQRCHGESGGRTITFGIRERHDVLGWIHWAGKRFGPEMPVILFGLSMGAATVLMGAGLGYPDSVACVIADSPYAAPADIIRKVCQDMHYPPKLCFPFIRLGAALFGRFRLNACSAVDAVRQARVPILLIHGEDDRLVPCAMSLVLKEACGGPCEICTFPEAGHGLSYMTAPLDYERQIFDFLNKIPVIARSISPDFKNSIKY